ncbi:peptidase domain-containing ABC transporter [Kitasatospora sp. NPDC048540]|uniref:peptidase domain-containing ABC transporter n=1 Tax=unclassified Kitasatospora TaxID=2633591 RepID=UPI00053AE340|nr:peptidase domain-containing ABC transporter [Kitasatospora sp. MBT63]
MSSPSEARAARGPLGGIPLLANLAPEVRELVADSFEPVRFGFGAVIVREGDPADGYWVLAEGTARAVKRGEHGEEVPLNTLGPGDSFGEVSLLENTTRSSTIRASSEVSALRLDSSVFAALVRAHPSVRTGLEQQVREHRVRDLLRVHHVFADLSVTALGRLIARLRPLRFSAGEAVVRQGDPPGGMYVVLDGVLRVRMEQSGEEREAGLLRTGDVFGEVSLFDSVPRTATVEATGDVELLELEPAVFGELLVELPEFRERVAEQVAGRHYRDRARVPPDFSEELLPAGTTEQRQRAEGSGPDVEVDEQHDLEDRFTRPERRIRRFPHVWQIDEADCGAACLAMVCRYFGRKVRLGAVRDAVRTGPDGTSLNGLAHGAEALGLTSATLKASKTRLDQLPLPAVVHYRGNHWVVLYDSNAKYARIADPAVGLRRVRMEEFLENWSGFAALFAPGEGFREQPEAQPSARWFLQLFGPHRGTLLRALGLSFVGAATRLFIPVLSAVVVDRVLADRDYGLLNMIVLGMLAAIVVATAATVVQRYILSRMTVRIDTAALDFLTGRLLALPMSYFNSRRIGDIGRRLDGVRQVRQLIVQTGVEALTAATQVIAALALMFVFNPVLALVYAAGVPVYAGLMRYSTRRIKPLFDSLEESYGRYQSRQIDAIRGIETVKAMGAEQALRGLMLTQFKELARRLFRADFTMMLYEGSVQLVSFVSLALFLWIGALEVLNGGLTIGGLVSFNSLVLLANGPIVFLVALWDQLQYSGILLGRLTDITEHEPEQGEDHSRLRAVPVLDGRIRFHDVGFSYGGPGGPPILEHVDLDVRPGQTVAIVGRSGSGKTTLIKCLAGLLEPTSGTITYDETDLYELDHRDLRRHIGFVLQENHLFEDTIARNIAFGQDEPDMDRVAWAARIAAAHDFIQRLPLGYETKIGESGLLLSGGQRQRIAIARAVYPRPPVLIFDEATSSLDSESEHAVQDNMARLFEGRASIVIAHRLSTVRNADRIVVLEQGRVVEQGTHDELMANQGLYYYLLSQQLGL